MARDEPVASKRVPLLQNQTLVVDPGANTIKAGLVPLDGTEGQESQCHIIPNCIARSRTKQTFIGSSLSRCDDFGEMQFRRPVERGFIVNWDLERAIFEHEFFDTKAPLHCDPSSTNLILSESPSAPLSLSSNADQIVFEEFSFPTYARMSTPSLLALNPLPPSLSSVPDNTTPPEIALHVHASHSHTLILPTLHGNPIPRAIRRLTFGGKHITNHLASTLSLRHFSLMDEPHLVAGLKETACFVSRDFAADLRACWPGPRSDRRHRRLRAGDGDIVREYVLPDYETVHRGYLRDPASTSSSSADNRPVDGGKPEKEEEGESFTLGNERFAAPELLFNPPDVGLREAGLPEAIVSQALAQVPAPLWHGLLGNVVVTGGTGLMPGFRDRLEAELRAVAPADVPVRVAVPERAVEAVWDGGARLARGRDALARAVVGRDEYLENGEGWVRRKFAAWRLRGGGGGGSGVQSDRTRDGS